MVADLKNLAARAALALGEERDFRISSAGRQEKTAYLRIDGPWPTPRGITPDAAHISNAQGLIPGPEQIDLSDGVENGCSA